MLPMNPQQMTIDQLPEEALAVQGWNQYQALETHRKQSQLCEQNILAIQQELTRRNQAKQEQAAKGEIEKKTEHGLLADTILAKLAERKALPPADAPTNGVPEGKEAKAE